MKTNEPLFLSDCERVDLSWEAEQLPKLRTRIENQNETLSKDAARSLRVGEAAKSKITVIGALTNVPLHGESGITVRNDASATKKVTPRAIYGILAKLTDMFAGFR